MSKIFRAIILGAPGSGKGTISKRVIKDFKLKYLASGDAIREEILKNTEIGQLAKQYTDVGKLVPDRLITQLILKNLKLLSDKNWLLDGYPRTVQQAETLNDAYQISLAISLDVPDEVIISRLKDRWLHAPSGRIYHLQFSPPKVVGKDDITGEDLIQRHDDLPHIVQARLDLYKEQNCPLIEYYRKKNMLEEFCGTETNEIWPRVKKYLEQVIN